MVILKYKNDTNHSKLNTYTKNLPKNYNFEIEKILNTIKKNSYKKIALQMPDGLLKYSFIITDTLKEMVTECDIDIVLLGDVVYGACCVDDISAYELSCDLVVHFGHSCLIPLSKCNVKCLYVFVDIFFDVDHAIKMIEKVCVENIDTPNYKKKSDCEDGNKSNNDNIENIDIPKYKKETTNDVKSNLNKEYIENIHTIEHQKETTSNDVNKSNDDYIENIHTIEYKKEKTSDGKSILNKEYIENIHTIEYKKETTSDGKSNLNNISMQNIEAYESKKEKDRVDVNKANYAYIGNIDTLKCKKESDCEDGNKINNDNIENIDTPKYKKETTNDDKSILNKEYIENIHIIEHKKEKTSDGKSNLNNICIENIDTPKYKKETTNDDKSILNKEYIENIHIIEHKKEKTSDGKSNLNNICIENIDTPKYKKETTNDDKSILNKEYIENIHIIEHKKETTNDGKSNLNNICIENIDTPKSKKETDCDDKSNINKEYIENIHTIEHKKETNRDNLINTSNDYKNETPHNNSFSNNTTETKIKDIEPIDIYKDIAILGTIQFNTAINIISKKLNMHAPQTKPLSKGEVLGCTSPHIKNKKIVIYIADGRFHLEAVMIRNPLLKYYKYCPFMKKMTREHYDYHKMIQNRKISIQKFKNESKKVGVILGDLGRQGNPVIFNNILDFLKNRKVRAYKIVLKEINHESLVSFSFCDAFVQVSCPRLSIDWGVNFEKPLLNPYELFSKIDEYSMDYYSNEVSQKWNNY